ncbi:uncharacterized protein EHS24_000976 [Apiotrichum porosum]|uniref:Uncharacterized protein n=1 Tax=Apiotrichum porosum TaxID=105984 RepID=A0A427YBB0_9TREE|nr:uncharacterized protein EHS24_000976 [Apiotrichum porosum]RSH88431.1 hypothetical protein EHS24_000976 [Apiotrichum porosum]
MSPTKKDISTHSGALGPHMNPIRVESDGDEMETISPTVPKKRKRVPLAKKTVRTTGPSAASSYLLQLLGRFHQGRSRIGGTRAEDLLFALQCLQAKVDQGGTDCDLAARRRAALPFVVAEFEAKLSVMSQYQNDAHSDTEAESEAESEYGEPYIEHDANDVGEQDQGLLIQKMNNYMKVVKGGGGLEAAEEQPAIIVRIRRIGMGLVEDGARCDFGPVTTMYDKWYDKGMCSKAHRVAVRPLSTAASTNSTPTTSSPATSTRSNDTRDTMYIRRLARGSDLQYRYATRRAATNPWPTTTTPTLPTRPRLVDELPVLPESPAFKEAFDAAFNADPTNRCTRWGAYLIVLVPTASCQNPNEKVRPQARCESVLLHGQCPREYNIYCKGLFTIAGTDGVAMKSRTTTELVAFVAMSLFAEAVWCHAAGLLGLCPSHQHPLAQGPLGRCQPRGPTLLSQSSRSYRARRNLRWTDAERTAHSQRTYGSKLTHAAKLPAGEQAARKAKETARKGTWRHNDKAKMGKEERKAWDASQAARMRLSRAKRANKPKSLIQALERELKMLASKTEALRTSRKNKVVDSQGKKTK